MLWSIITKACFNLGKSGTTDLMWRFPCHQFRIYWNSSFSLFCWYANSSWYCIFFLLYWIVTILAALMSDVILLKTDSKPAPIPVCCLIQSRNCITRANTVKTTLALHVPEPQLTAPCRVYVLLSEFRHTYGPPLSPWQPLKMVFSTPAHNISEVKGTDTKKKWK